MAAAQEKGRGALKGVSEQALGWLREQTPRLRKILKWIFALAATTILGGYMKAYWFPSPNRPAEVCGYIDRGDKNILGQSVFGLQDRLKDLDNADGLITLDCGYVRAISPLMDGTSIALIEDKNNGSSKILCLFDKEWTRKLMTIDNSHSVFFEGTISKNSKIGGTLILNNCHILHEY
jgi:hypothetical protein